MLYNNSTLINIAMWHNASMSQSTTFMYVIMPQFPWMSQYYIHFDECHNVTKTLLYVTLWHVLWCTSQCDINFDVCDNVPSTLMMLSSDINFEECWNVTFINGNHGQLWSTMVTEVQPWSLRVSHGQIWSTMVNHDQVESSIVYRGHPWFTKVNHCQPWPTMSTIVSHW